MIDVRWQSPESRNLEARTFYQQDLPAADSPPPAEQPRRRGAGERHRVLMSAANPDGFKLEELLARVLVDIREKNELLAKAAEFGVDPQSARKMAVRTRVRERNERIAGLLMQALLVQNETITDLAQLGPDPGPRGVARV